MVSDYQLFKAAEAAEQGDLVKIGMFSPDFGAREDIPKLILPDLLTAENVNIRHYNGELHRFKMRLPECLESEFATGTITATNGSATITASGGAGTFGTSANHKPNWGSDQVSGTGRKITITDDGADTEYTIKDVADNGATLTLTTNYTGTGGAGLSYSIGKVGTAVPVPDGNPVIKYHRLLQNAGGTEVEYLYAFTKAHAYIWNTVWSAWITKFTCSGDCDFWATETYDEQVVATNWVDKVQVHGSTIANAFDNLTGDADGIDIGGGTYIKKAKYVKSYENYLILGFVDIAGTVYPDDLIWCSKDDETDFDQTGAGDAGQLSLKGGGPISGMGYYDGYLIVFKKGGNNFTGKTFYGWLTTESVVFYFDTLVEDVGCRAFGSIINDKKGRLCWLADDLTIRRLPGAEIVSKPKDKTFKNILTSLQEKICSTYLNEYGLLLWSIPYGSGATANNKVVWLDPEKLIMGSLDMAVYAFGKWTRQDVYDWSTLPFDSWDEWGWADWAGPENDIGFVLDLCSDADGYTYDLHAAELDAGEEYTGYFVISTDMVQQLAQKRLGITLNTFKRLEYCRLWFYNESDSDAEAIFKVKRDTEPSWQTVKDDISLDDSAGLNREIFPTEINLDELDLRARHFLLYVGASNAFRFVGMVLGFMNDGDEEM
ncbi:MAG: hypothetical protein PVJ60_06350 [Phycisphaerales bacterium]|jgi:hypothetical protein